MQFSLRFKIALSLLVTSLLAVALVGGTARWLLLRHFNALTQEDAFSRFRISVVAYIKRYGTLDNAIRREPFPEFQRRWDAQRAHRMGKPASFSPFRNTDPQPAGSVFSSPTTSGSPLAGPSGGFVPPPSGVGGPEARALGGPPPDDTALPGEEPPDGFLPDRGPPDQGAPDRGPDTGAWSESGSRPGLPDVKPRDEDQPPYLFLLANPEWRVAAGDRTYRPGTLVPTQIRKLGTPIQVNGRIAAWAVALDNPNLNGTDQAYLRAVSQALIIAVIAAAVFTTALGILLGRRLCGDLRKLTRAVEAVGQGQLYQEVKIGSRDEIGTLARAFNQMSAELAHAHEELQQSAERIRQQAAQLQELSARDGLTGLYNRRYFDEQCRTFFAQADRYELPMTLAIGDIDCFKRINDQFSHSVGDEVLRRVARILQAGIRESDLVARYGGEEFVLAFTTTTAAQAWVACEKLRRQIEAHPWHDVHPDLKVTMSLGLCDDRALGSPEKMLGAADLLLYQAKEHGRNKVCGPHAAAPGATVSGA